jgi:hypothetical protein
MLPFIETACPANTGEEIVVWMTPPDEETLKTQLEAEAIRINNVGLQLRMGAISDRQAAQQLGLEEWSDKERLEEWRNNSGGDTNTNDPNQVQQVRAGLNSLNSGKRPSNNPSGERE